MGFSVDISKLTSSQTWQVILAVVFVGGASITATFLKDNKFFGKMEEMDDKLTDIYIQQQFFEKDLWEVMEDVDGIHDTLNSIETKIGGIKANQSAQSRKLQNGLDMAEFWWENKNTFSEEQMDVFIEKWIKKNKENNTDPIVYISEEEPLIETISSTPL